MKTYKNTVTGKCIFVGDTVICSGNWEEVKHAEPKKAAPKQAAKKKKQ